MDTNKPQSGERANVDSQCESLYTIGMTFPNPDTKIDEENYERDRRVAALIRSRSETIELAKQNLRDWAARWGELNPAWQEWVQLLQMLTPAQLADFLESHTPKANRLRQSSPFIGVLETDKISAAA